MIHGLIFGPPQGAPDYDFTRYHRHMINAIQKIYEAGVAGGEVKKTADGEVAYLFLDGGGALSVPVERLANWHELPVPEPVEEEAAPLVSDSEAWRAAAGEYADLFARAAAEHDIDPALLTAISSAVSAVGRTRPKNAGLARTN